MWLKRRNGSSRRSGHIIYSSDPAQRPENGGIGPRPVRRVLPWLTGGFLLKLGLVVATALLSGPTINIFLSPAPGHQTEIPPSATVPPIPKFVFNPPDFVLPPAALTNGQITVPGTAMPWLWQAGGQNSNYTFSQVDGTGPAIFRLSQFNAKPGQNLTIRYVSGEVDVGGIFSPGDANGVPSPYSNGGDGSTGTPFPADYMQSHPINLGDLVGTFADGAGSIVGEPFAIGDGPVTEDPAGAAQLQFGINDDRYSDNTGSFVVSVAVSGAAPPAPPFVSQWDFLPIIIEAPVTSCPAQRPIMGCGPIMRLMQCQETILPLIFAGLRITKRLISIFCKTARSTHKRPRHFAPQQFAMSPNGMTKPGMATIWSSQTNRNSLCSC